MHAAFFIQFVRNEFDEFLHARFQSEAPDICEAESCFNKKWGSHRNTSDLDQVKVVTPVTPVATAVPRVVAYSGESQACCIYIYTYIYTYIYMSIVSQPIQPCLTWWF